MSSFETLIGLETHAQLNTASKMFCSCPQADYAARANSSICPVCTGQPGTMPAANKKAVELGVKAGIALNCRVNEVSIFTRKNYFYPDLPKSYQVSQFDRPLCEAGSIEIDLKPSGSKTIRIARANELKIKPEDYLSKTILPASVVALAGLVTVGAASASAAKTLFAKSWETGKDPGTLLGELGLAQINDAAQTEAWAREAISYKEISKKRMAYCLKLMAAFLPMAYGVVSYCWNKQGRNFIGPAKSFFKPGHAGLN